MSESIQDRNRRESLLWISYRAVADNLTTMREMQRNLFHVGNKREILPGVPMNEQTQKWVSLTTLIVFIVLSIYGGLWFACGFICGLIAMAYVLIVESKKIDALEMTVKNTIDVLSSKKVSNEKNRKSK